MKKMGRGKIVAIVAGTALAVLAIVAACAFGYMNAPLWNGDTAQAVEQVESDAEPGHHIYKLGDVSFHVEIPRQIEEGSVGLILDMHGASMNAQCEDDGTNMRKLGSENGYIVVQPECPRPMVPETMDEPVWAMVSVLREKLSVDENRIHMTGFSMGGLMTWRFVRDHSDVLASVAPIAAAPWNKPVDPAACTFEGDDIPSEQVDILQIQGTQDPVISYDSAIRLRDNVRTAWGMDKESTVSSDDTYRRYRYENDEGTVYEFIEHDYTSDAPLLMMPIEGHCFPGGKAVYDAQNPTNPIAFGCKDDASFAVGEEVIRFFMEHPREQRTI